MLGRTGVASVGVRCPSVVLIPEGACSLPTCVRLQGASTNWVDGGIVCVGSGKLNIRDLLSKSQLVP